MYANHCLISYIRPPSFSWLVIKKQQLERLLCTYVRSSPFYYPFLLYRYWFSLIIYAVKSALSLEREKESELAMLSRFNLLTQCHTYVRTYRIVTYLCRKIYDKKREKEREGFY